MEDEGGGGGQGLKTRYVVVFTEIRSSSWFCIFCISMIKKMAAS